MILLPTLIDRTAKLSEENTIVLIDSTKQNEKHDT